MFGLLLKITPNMENALSAWMEGQKMIFPFLFVRLLALIKQNVKATTAVIWLACEKLNDTWAKAHFI